jgi:hypothetical protein
VDLDEYMTRSNARARRGRYVARLILAAAVSLAATIVVAFAPALSSGLGAATGPDGLPALSPALGIGGTIVGLVWMIRILHADYDPDAATWRYRDF